MPIYEVEEVTMEQALSLLNVRNNHKDETIVSRLENRLGIAGEVDEMQQMMERLAAIWSPVEARG